MPGAEDAGDALSGAVSGIGDVFKSVSLSEQLGINDAIGGAIGVNPLDLAASSAIDPIGIGGQFQFGGSGGLGNEVQSGIQDLTGESAAIAAEEAAELQAAAGSDAVANLRQAQIEAAARQQPFEDFGVTQGLEQLPGAFGQLQSAISDPTAGVINNPFFQALSADQDRRLAASSAARGKFASGGTDDAFARQQLLLGNQFSQQNIGNIQSQIQNQFNAATLGQNAAAGTGAQGLRTAGNIGGIIGNVANSQAAGILGAQQAQAAGTGNLIGLAGTIGSFFV